jgi:hypothetical protein
MARILAFVLGRLFWGGRTPQGISPSVTLIINFMNPCGSKGHGFKHSHVVRVPPLFFGIEITGEFGVQSRYRFSQVSFVSSLFLAEDDFKLLDRILGEGEFFSEAQFLNLIVERVEAARATRGMQSFHGHKVRPVSFDPRGDDSQRLFQLLLGPFPFEDLYSPVLKLMSPEHCYSQTPRSGINGEHRVKVISHVVGLRN